MCVPRNGFGKSGHVPLDILVRLFNMSTTEERGKLGFWYANSFSHIAIHKYASNLINNWPQNNIIETFDNLMLKYSIKKWVLKKPVWISFAIVWEFCANETHAVPFVSTLLRLQWRKRTANHVDLICPNLNRVSAQLCVRGAAWCPGLLSAEPVIVGDSSIHSCTNSTRYHTWPKIVVCFR